MHGRLLNGTFGPIDMEKSPLRMDRVIWSTAVVFSSEYALPHWFSGGVPERTGSEHRRTFRCDI